MSSKLPEILVPSEMIVETDHMRYVFHFELFFTVAYSLISDEFDNTTA